MSEELKNELPQRWKGLRSFTPARIAIGRTGVSVTAEENLSFKLAHAKARDAVYDELNPAAIENVLKRRNQSFIHTRSLATDRKTYLLRPDLGRQLCNISIDSLKQERNENGYDLCICIADGLSASAINSQGHDFLDILIPLLEKENIALAPVVLIEQGRVAISDAIGSLLNARLAVMLIGERPGLSNAESMGIYLTWAPAPGNTDAQRNCISNVGHSGISQTRAAEELIQLIKESIRQKISGIKLITTKGNGENLI
jgi:ethanolamine ammonia-lyase small subunit